MSEFSENLKWLTREKNITYQKLSDEVGLTKTAIVNYATGKQEPSLRNLIKIADVLNVGLDELAGRYKPEELYLIHKTKNDYEELKEKLIKIIQESKVNK